MEEKQQATLPPWPKRSWWRRVPFISTKIRPLLSSLDENSSKAYEMPEINASWISRVWFSWADSLLLAGYVRPIEKDDLYLLPDKRKSSVLGDRLVEALKQRQAQRTRLPALVWAMNDTVFWYLWIGGAFKLLADIGTITSPLIVRALIDFVQDSYNNEAAAPPINKGIGLAFALFIVQALCVFLNVHAFNRGFGSGILLRSALIQAIFQRGMQLSHQARSTNLGVSRLVTLISADATRIDYAGQFFHMAWTSAVQILICVALLLWSLRYSALPGIAILFLLSPLQTVITKRLFGLRKESMVWTDKRNKAINEVIGGVRLVKQFAWEQPYADRINTLRVREMTFHRKRLYLRSLNLALAFATPTIAAVLSFVTYALVGNDLNAGIIFSSLSFFTLLRTPLQFLPIAWNAVVDAKNAADRIQQVFDAPLQEDEIVIDTNAEYGIRVKDASFTWQHRGDTKEDDWQEVKDLDKINLVVPKGTLCAVVGGVASGKSSLISALAGEMKQLEGKVVISSSLSTCSQTAWILSTTIRNNILFGHELDMRRYNNVLELCCLLHDLKTLADGDQTVVGEKGVSLSGGQKQRINLARALYHDSDIVLLDDCLSALDASVAARIFDNVINGEGMARKTRLLVTHSLHFLRACDYVVVMEQGRIARQGTYEEVLRSGGILAGILQSHSDHEQTCHEVENTATSSFASVESQDTIAGKANDERKSTSFKPPKALMQDEERYTGSVSKQTYIAYVTSTSLIVLLPSFLLAVIVFQGSTILSPVSLLWWQRDSFGWPKGVYMAVYAIFGITQSLGLLAMGILFSTFSIMSATRLHQKALWRVLCAPFSFFDTTPQGRITHRFSKDMDTLDNIIAEAMRTLIGTIVQVIGSIILIAVLVPYFLIAVAIIIVIYFWIALFYRSTARELRRLDAGLRSNMHEHFSESLQGLVTIRSYGQTDVFVQENCRRIDRQTRAYWLAQTCQRWLSVRLDFLGSLLVFAVALLTVGTRFTISPGETGVALSYILTAQSIFGWMIRHAAELENNMSAVERVLHYAERIEQESAYCTPADQKLAEQNWPANGHIRFEEVQVKYNGSTANTLEHVSLDIAAGEKIAFCGRTGAGKSTLMSTLLRTIEVSGGKISIDGVDISTVGLQNLRRNVSLIPQDPTIYSGTLRYNLDPLGQYDDAKLWDVVKRTNLSSQSTWGLDSEIQEEGSDLSIGQRALISLARALVRQSKIVILDEATASIDQQTEKEIQDVLKTHFHGTTTLTVAHRIRTILGCNRVCVLQDGKVAEIGDPVTLYTQGCGAFRALCQDARVHYSDGQWR